MRSSSSEVGELCVEGGAAEDVIAMRYPSSKTEEKSPIKVFLVLFSSLGSSLCVVLRPDTSIQVRIKSVV